jgi:hypothetical protein
MFSLWIRGSSGGRREEGKKLLARGAFVWEGGQSYTANYTALALVSGAIGQVSCSCQVNMLDCGIKGRQS